MRLFALLHGLPSRISLLRTHRIACAPTSHNYTQTLLNKPHLKPKHFPESQELMKNQFFSMLCSCNNVNSLKKIHALLLVNGHANKLPCQTKLVSAYASLGLVQWARMVFDGVPKPDLYSWRVMFRWYLLHECHAEIIGLYRQMRRWFSLQDNIIVSTVLKTCVKLLNLDEGMKVHCEIAKAGNPDCFVLNVLIDMYAKCGDMDGARRTFDEVPERNVVSWTSIISSYVQNNCPEDGLVVFNEMRQENIEPNERTVVSLLTACSMLDALHQGKWVHGYMIKVSLEMNSFVGTALLDMYAKCGKVDDARAIFDELRNVDVVSWTAMIVGYTQKGHPIEALKLFVDKKWANMIPNSVTITSALSACGQLGDVNLGKSIHMLTMKLGLEEYDVIGNALVDMYAKCGRILEANYVFENISQKTIVAWNAMIAGYSQNNFGYDALLLFYRMRLQNCLPDAITVVSALSACACLGDSYTGSSIHAYAIKCAFLSSVYVSTALLNIYNKSGDPKSAHRVFDEMDYKNIVTWCAMMGGYGMQGDSGSCITMFSNMLRVSLQPSDAAFTSVLSACSHTGMVEMGKRCFDIMSQHHSMVPSMKHCACVVDMLARAGKLEEALEFIKSMPMQAEVGVWGAFLHGCRLHSRLDLGEVAVKKMVDLQPETADYYVLISNFYALDGSWDEAIKIRELMKARGLIKSLGCSSVGIHNISHSNEWFHVHSYPSEKIKMFFPIELNTN